MKVIRKESLMIGFDCYHKHQQFRLVVGGGLFNVSRSMTIFIAS